MFIGVEIGATKHQICLCDGAGNILDRDSGNVVLEDGATGILAWMKAHIDGMIARHPEMPVRALSIGFGGIVETATGLSLFSVQVDGWENFNIKNWFETTFNLPCFVLNDTVAGGFAEYYNGTGKGVENFFYTNIGSGIGGVFFLNGRYYDGSGRGAAYFGHTYIPDWTRDAPYAYDELENLCSGFGIQNRLRREGYVPQDSRLMALCGGAREKITTKMLGQAAAAGDAFSLKEIKETAAGYSVGLANVITLIHPQVISIGGGVANMGDLLLEPIRKYTARKVFMFAKDQYRIVKCKYGDDAVPVGAVVYAAQALENK